jgi:dienelactone hydrolase
MSAQSNTRRDFLMMGVGVGTLGVRLRRSGLARTAAAQARQVAIDETFFVRPQELTLRLDHGPAERRLSFGNFKGTPATWRQACRDKFAELLGFFRPPRAEAHLLRSAAVDGVTVEAWVMKIDESLSIPAYFLQPRSGAASNKAVMAIHGHGEAEPCLGLHDDYHHAFALKLAQAGHLVLCPALRGFGALGDMAFSDEDRNLDYWRSVRGRQFTLVTDAFLYGKTLIGATVEDLLRWENWLAQSKGIRTVDVAGISYGGDLALTYPVFSERVRRTYSSGSLGSFSVVFSHCYNAPAHAIPGVLRWMDRSDIAGLNAPRPIQLHYGERDTPGPHNNSASYNQTVEPALNELKRIYRAFGAENQISLKVTPEKGHEIDNDDLQDFLAG